MYQEGSPACKGGGSASAAFKERELCYRPGMPRTKKSIKNRSKVKRQALKRKRARRKKSLRRGMRAK
jgi:hypothetical protein